MNIKKQIKKCISQTAIFFPMKSKLESVAARECLQRRSPKPVGVCTTQNAVDIAYDMQIIIPAYNVEAYVQECVDSVLAQITSYRILVTIVNDGSTDGTGDILKRLPEKCGNIHLEIIEQENRGLTGARNRAMELLRGRYIMFLDSDDVLPENTVENMLRAACEMDADILQGGYYTFHEKSRKKVEVQPKTLTGFPWGKLYKYTVMERFQFPEGYWFEDTPVSFLLAAMPWRCHVIADVVYGYRQNPAGITASCVRSDKAIDSYWITEECLKEFPDFGLSYDQRAYEYLLRQSLMNEWRVRHREKEVREAVFVLTCELMEHYFPEYKTENRRMKKLEQALRNRQFVRFELLAFGM